MTRYHNKSNKMLNRLSRLFHKEEKPLPTPPPTIISNSYNSSLPILLQRAPSSKLLIDDDAMDVSTIEYSHSFSDLYETKRQSWFATIKSKTIKGKKSAKRTSSECWFVTQPQQQQGAMVEILDQQLQQQQHKEEKEEGVMTIEEQVKKLDIPSPLSISSSIHSSQQYNSKHHLSSSSSFWLTIEEGDTSTARTSFDEHHIKETTKCIHLAENVKSILGDAILLADKELDI